MGKAKKKPTPTKGGNKKTPNEGNQRAAGDNTEPTKPSPPLRKGNPKPDQQVRTG